MYYIHINTKFRLFVSVSKNELKDLVRSLEEINDVKVVEVSENEFKKLPISRKLERWMGAVLFDVTYYGDWGVPWQPRHYAYRCGVDILWESNMLLNSNRGIRYLTVIGMGEVDGMLESIDNICEIYRGCISGEASDGTKRRCRGDVSVTRGKVPILGIGDYKNGWMLTTEGPKEREDEIRRKVSSIIPDFGYTVEEKVNMPNNLELAMNRIKVSFLNKITRRR